MLRKVFLLFLIATNSIVIALAQVNCHEKYGDFPIGYEGQKCWTEYYLRTSIWVYNDKNNNNAQLYNILNIPTEEIDNYFKADVGTNIYYLDRSKVAWGGNYWPCTNGGIAYRNSATMQKIPTSQSLNWNEILRKNEQELFVLSPAEKMDVYLGNKNFDITKFELQNRGPERKIRTDDSYCGYCNGARIAGALLPEPHNNVVVYSSANQSIKITFSPSDIKALATAIYMHPSKYFSIGFPDTTTRNRLDPNPAIVDVFTRLYLGNYHIPFMIDAVYTPSIFNETVLGYKRTITKYRDLTSGEKNYIKAAQAIEIDLVLYLQDELTIERSNASTIDIMSDSAKALKEKSQSATYGTWVHKKKYTYNLYVDAQKKIVDGRWRGEPIDFLWTANGDGNEDNHLTSLTSQPDQKTPSNLSLKFSSVIDLVRKSVENK